jgi:CRP-like cAMP-binding protein
MILGSKAPKHAGHFLEKNPLFAQCSDRFWAEIASSSREIFIEKGRLLFVHGDPAERFYVINTGWIKLYRETLDGTQAVIDILPAGELFGEHSLFNGGVYTYSAEAAEGSQIFTLPIQSLKNELAQNPAFALDMLNAMAGQKKKQDNEIEHRTLQTAPQRIGCFILRLTQGDENNACTVHLPYDKTLIAARLGMQPETFSRALKKLKDETDIEIKGSSIEIKSLDKLSEYTCSACSSDIFCLDVEDTDKDHIEL